MPVLKSGPSHPMRLASAGLKRKHPPGAGVFGLYEKIGQSGLAKVDDEPLGSLMVTVGGRTIA